MYGEGAKGWGAELTQANIRICGEEAGFSDGGEEAGVHYLCGAVPRLADTEEEGEAGCVVG